MASLSATASRSTVTCDSELTYRIINETQKEQEACASAAQKSNFQLLSLKVEHLRLDNDGNPKLNFSMCLNDFSEKVLNEFAYPVFGEKIPDTDFYFDATNNFTISYNAGLGEGVHTVPYRSRGAIPGRQPQATLAFRDWTVNPPSDKRISFLFNEMPRSVDGEPTPSFRIRIRESEVNIVAE